MAEAATNTPRQVPLSIALEVARISEKVLVTALTDLESDLLCYHMPAILQEYADMRLAEHALRKSPAFDAVMDQPDPDNNILRLVLPEDAQ